jgi:hypothetical protein
MRFVFAGQPESCRLWKTANGRLPVPTAGGFLANLDAYAGTCDHAINTTRMSCSELDCSGPAVHWHRQSATSSL